MLCADRYALRLMAVWTSAQGHDIFTFGSMQRRLTLKVIPFCAFWVFYRLFFLTYVVSLWSLHVCRALWLCSAGLYLPAELLLFVFRITSVPFVPRRSLHKYDAKSAP